MKILNFGSCNIDRVYRMAHIVAPGETEGVCGYDVLAGGKGLNQSVAAARAGATVYHAACIGKGGELLSDTLTQSGVRTDYLRWVDAENGHAIIQVSDTGENAIFVYPGSNGMVTHEYIDEVLSRFDAGDMLILQNEISNVPYLIREAGKKQMTVLFNPSPLTEDVKNTDFSQISYIVVNETEAKYLCGTCEPQDFFDTLNRRYPHLRAVLTLGADGAYCKANEEIIYCPSRKTKVVDTTAAGDTFLGYFAAALTENRREDEAMQLATVAASVAVSRPGASPSIPERAEVDKILREEY